MGHTYPVFLDLNDKRCLVVGGGEVAERKVQALLDTGARVRVISPVLTNYLSEAVQSGQIEAITRSYSRGDIAGAFLVISATDDEIQNRQVAEDCLRENILVNVVDDPGQCSFIVPAVVRRGSLAIAVSTDGKSPLLSRRIREKLAEQFGWEYADYVEILGELRRRIIAEVADISRRRQLFADLVDSDILELMKNGETQKVKERIKDVLGGSGLEP